jgi:hypothetical protein
LCSGKWYILLVWNLQTGNTQVNSTWRTYKFMNSFGMWGEGGAFVGRRKIPFCVFWILTVWFFVCLLVICVCFVCLFVFFFALDYRNTLLLQLIWFYSQLVVMSVSHGCSNRSQLQKKPLLCSSSCSSILYCQINELALLTLLTTTTNQPSYVYCTRDNLYPLHITICVLRRGKKKA